MKTLSGDDDAASAMLYDKVKESGLREKELDMYFVSASFKVHTRPENQSISDKTFGCVSTCLTSNRTDWSVLKNINLIQNSSLNLTMI